MACIEFLKLIQYNGRKRKDGGVLMTSSVLFSGLFNYKVQHRPFLMYSQQGILWLYHDLCRASIGLNVFFKLFRVGQRIGYQLIFIFICLIFVINIQPLSFIMIIFMVIRIWLGCLASFWRFLEMTRCVIRRCGQIIVDNVFLMESWLVGESVSGLTWTSHDPMEELPWPRAFSLFFL